MTLVPVDPTNALAVSDYLIRARDWLATAVERTGPTEIAAAKAGIATAAEATKQLGLSKEIQMDAEEMVRRAEFALGKAIRKGQADGVIGTRADGGWDARARSLQGLEPTLKSAGDFFGSSQQRSETYALSDDVTPEEFEQALSEAKDEGNLSRANVVRKVKGQADGAGLTRRQRADLISDLATQGYSSHQMADKVGVRADTVREIARSFDVDIPADRMVGRQRRIDHTAAVESAVTSLDNWASSLNFIDFSQVDDDEVDPEWTASLKESRRRLSAFISDLEKRTARVAPRAVRTTHTGATHV